MATETGMTERIECVVDTPTDLSGLNKTIAALEVFERAINRITGKLGAIGGTKAASQFEPILQQIKQMQQFASKGPGGKLLDIKPIELNKVFGLKFDRAQLDRELSSFVAELKRTGTKVGDIFESGQGTRPFAERTFASANIAASFVSQQLRTRAQAAEDLRRILQITSTPAHPTPEQVAGAMQTPPKVTIARVEPEAQRQVEQPAAPLPTPKAAQVEIPKSIITPKRVEKLSVVKKGTATLPLKFEDALDQAAYLANQAADKEIRRALGDWADSKLQVAKDEFFEHGKKVARVVKTATKNVKKGAVTVQPVTKTFTMPMEPVLGPAPEPPVQVSAPAPLPPPTAKPIPHAAAYSFSQALVAPKPEPPPIPEGTRRREGEALYERRGAHWVEISPTAPSPPAVPPAGPPPRPPVATAAVPAPGGEPQGQIHLRIQGSQIVAEVTSPIHLRIPGNLIQATIEGRINATGTAAAPAGETLAAAPATPGATPPAGSRGTPAAAPSGRAPTPAPDIAAQAGEIKREITETAKGAVTKITQALKPGEVVTRTFAPNEKAKRTVQTTGRKTPEEEFERGVREELQTELNYLKGRGRVLKTAATPETLETLAAHTRESAQRLQAAFAKRVEDLTGKATNARERQKVQTVIDPAQADIDRRVADLNSAAQQLEFRSGELRLKIARQQEAALNRVRETGAKANVRAEANATKQVELENKRQEAIRTQQAVVLRAAEAQSMIEKLKGEGYQYVGAGPSIAKKTTEKGDREVETHRLRKTENGERREQVVTIERVGTPPQAPGAPAPKPGRVTAAAIAPEKVTREPLTSSTMGFAEYAFQKGKALATYAGEAMILYGTLNEVQKALSSMINTGLQVARLSQVFRGVGGSARDVIDDVLELAATEGKTAKEAEDSAVSWARLGLTRAQTDEAVRVSLQAANIAIVDTTAATEHLQTVMLAYGLQVKDLQGVLGAVNSVSQQYSVTQSQLFDALSRTASIAKQVGLPFEELNGLLGAVIATSGQTGVAVGNTMKTLMASLSKPDIQKFLRQEFKMEVTVGGGSEVKAMSQILKELFVTYERSNQMERQIMLTHILGAQNVSRLAALFDSYVQGQVAGINAQLRLNSAEEASARIRATLHNRLVGLRAELERFFAASDQRIGLTDNLAELTLGFTNVLRVAQEVSRISSSDFLTKFFPSKPGKIAEINDQRENMLKILGQAAGGISKGLEPTGLANIGSSILAGFNFAMDKIGVSTSGVEKKIAAFDSEIRRAGGAMKASTQAVQLYDTAIQSLLNMPEGEALKMVEEMSKLGTVEGPDKFKTDLTVAVKTRNQGSINDIMGEQIARARAAAIQENQRKLEAIANQRGTIETAIKNVRFPNSVIGREQIKKLEDQLVQKRTEGLVPLQEEERLMAAIHSSYDAMLQSDVKHLTFLDSQKLTMEAIANTYRLITRTTPLDEHFSGIATLQAQLNFLERQKAELEAIQQQQRQIKAEATPKGEHPVENVADYELTKRIAQTREAAAQTEAQLAARRLATENVVAETKLMVAREIAGSQGRAFEYGDTEIDRLRNRERALRSMLAQRAEVIDSKATNEADRQAAIVMQLEQQAQLAGTRLELEKHRLDIVKDEYEYNRKLLTAGPAELLQRIVAQRITQRGPVSAAQFSALSPELREKVLEQSAMERERRFAAETPSPNEAGREIAILAAQQLKYLEALSRTVKTPPMSSTFNQPIQTNEAHVYGKVVNVHDESAKGGAKSESQAVPGDQPGTVGPKFAKETGAGESSWLESVWAFMKRPVGSYLPDNTEERLRNFRIGPRSKRQMEWEAEQAQMRSEGNPAAAGQGGFLDLSPLDLLLALLGTRRSSGSGSSLGPRTQAKAGEIPPKLRPEQYPEEFSYRPESWDAPPKLRPEKPTVESVKAQMDARRAVEESIQGFTPGRLQKLTEPLERSGQAKQVRELAGDRRTEQEIAVMLNLTLEQVKAVLQSIPKTAAIVGGTAAVVGSVGSVTTEAAEPIQRTEVQPPQSQRQQVQQQVEEFARQSRITLAPEPTATRNASFDGLELTRANLALSQFTQVVDGSSAALSQFTETVTTAMEDLATGFDDLSRRVDQLMPVDKNAGAPKIPEAY